MRHIGHAECIIHYGSHNQFITYDRLNNIQMINGRIDDKPSLVLTEPVVIKVSLCLEAGVPFLSEFASSVWIRGILRRSICCGKVIVAKRCDGRYSIQRHT